MNVLWRSSVGAGAYAELKHLLDESIRVTAERDIEKAKEQLDWYSVLIDGRPDEALLDAPNLKHVIVPYVGIHDTLRESMLSRPQLKLYNSHFNDAFVAQHAAALLLSVANRLTETTEALRQGDWTAGQDTRLESMFLEDKTCLLLGYGAIGKEIEKRLRAFGMKISALRRHPDKTSEITEYGTNELYKALAQADVLMISLPSTPETKGLLNGEAFNHVRQGSILVNVGRANVIDQHALYEALTNGTLLGAGLDVWWTYPKDDEAKKHTFPADAPLHELPNVTMSPHRAASVKGWQAAAFKDVAKTLNALAKGKSRNRLEVARGY